MIFREIFSYGILLKLTPVVLVLVSSGLSGIMDDPGLPGGDPDLPDAPFDGGVYILVALALIYGFRKIRSIQANRS